ncbi:hypothetical protein EV182_004082 [Spiromyces aspiralis]|uniref:Uncharacterized protein n=1 Tax=Spiromyces aspiralis TaxID=68401 RepID=A0ACC1HE88_9FUNG|nr:hypothetical protein EV182_004082 [Spiromyces aspiralis]
MVKRYKPKKKPAQAKEDTSRDLPPTKVVSGGKAPGKNGKDKRASGAGEDMSDMPKSFQRLMNFVNNKKQAEQRGQAAKQRPKSSKHAVLKMRPGESYASFERRVKQNMEKRLQEASVDALPTNQSQSKQNQSEDLGNGKVSVKSERKRKNEQARKERLKRQKKGRRRHGDDGDDDSDPSDYDSSTVSAGIETTVTDRRWKGKPDRARVKADDDMTEVDQDELHKLSKSLKKKKPAPAPRIASDTPKFNETVSAPPIFTSLPKARFKKMVPIEGTREAQDLEKKKTAMAIKKMIERTSRLSPLERLQQQRKLKQTQKSGEGGISPAEQKALEIERQKAIQRYRLVKVARYNNKSLV